MTASVEIYPGQCDDPLCAIEDCIRQTLSAVPNISVAEKCPKGKIHVTIMAVGAQPNAGRKTKLIGGCKQELRTAMVYIYVDAKQCDPRQCTGGVAANRIEAAITCQLLCGCKARWTGTERTVDEKTGIDTRADTYEIDYWHCPQCEQDYNTK